MYYVKNISLVFMLIGLSYCQTGIEHEEELTAKMMRAGAGAAEAEAEAEAEAGAAAVGGQDTFYIYTTGITSWGQADIIDSWRQGVFLNIIASIPHTFDSIEIQHFDPMIGAEDHVKRKIIKTIVEPKLLTPDRKVPRVTSSQFIPHPFNHQVRNPHIVIDFAHIYSYTNHPNEVRVHGAYDEEDAGQGTFPINSVYLGYPAKLGFNKIFEVQDDGRIVTYIDKMIQLHYPFNKYQTLDFILKTYKQIRLHVEQRVKELRNVNSVMDIEHITIQFVPFQPNHNTLEKIFNHIWSNTPVDTIIESIGTDIIRENQEIILPN